ncbi:MAG: ABC transporter ATP-binding protein [Desulfatiglans sp.]|jgi:branched-chain amino acid transport system ATP-binding protein|nr:ABC transporter ATP-binding protein [Thermodesulfobacteriota bacterium]MEE4354631.1 ABC transporter ATP-binding protein [Desulfatiglans sp.]
MGNAYILEVKNVTKDFGGVRALHDVSFCLREGEFLGVIGPNGSGKSTLVNSITGFVKPTSGSVVFRGKDITGKRPYTISRLGIGRTFQMAKAYHHLPAFKNVIIPLCSKRVGTFKGGRYGERDDIALDLLEEVGFERDSSIPYKLANSLPHGYLKRLELARCLALRSEIVILDELFSGMSMSEVASTLPIVEKLKTEGRTVIMIEHRLKELFRVVNKIVVLNFGMKIAEGSPEEVMEREAVRSAYLGSEE